MANGAVVACYDICLCAPHLVEVANRPFHHGSADTPATMRRIHNHGLDYRSTIRGPNEVLKDDKLKCSNDHACLFGNKNGDAKPILAHFDESLTHRGRLKNCIRNELAVEPA
jgi:hypothetical protein